MDEIEQLQKQIDQLREDNYKNYVMINSLAENLVQAVSVQQALIKMMIEINLQIIQMKNDLT